MLTSKSNSKEFSVHFFLTKAGGGHYATLEALRSIIHMQQRPWKIDVAESLEIFESLDTYKKLFGMNAGEVYDLILKNSWTWICPFTYYFNKKAIQHKYNSVLRILTEYWHQQQPDIVVSLVPFFNQLIWDSLCQAKPGTPFVTNVTDFADYPSHFWIEPQAKNYLICGTERLVEQAHSMGIEEDRIFHTSGMVIHPKFYKPIIGDRQMQRQELGLEPDCLTGIVLFGGHGSKVMLKVAKYLEHFKGKLQLIFICGHNEELADALRNSSSQLQKCVIGFTDKIPYYMHLADFLIGKPGPGGISEALAMKLPVIVERNIATLPQERYVTDWIVEKQVGLVVNNFRNIAQAVDTLLQSDVLVTYANNIMDLNNQAVFEVPDILQKIMDREAI